VVDQQSAPHRSWLAGVCVVGVVLTGLAAAQAQTQAAGDQIISPATAATLLREPATMDPGSRRVISRAEAAYRKLRTLKTINRDGGMTGVAYLARPLRFHLSQKLVTGEPVALAVSDGGDYYEYRYRSKQYRQRPAATLKALALPVNVRLFVDGQTASATLVGMDGKPTVREYGYRHRGKERISGGPAERVDVSIMVRSPDGKWHSFTSQRYYDASTGLLRRAINGGRTMEIENYPNATIPAGQFRWSPPVGAMKGLG
jgi:hypothetical protein